MLQQVISYKKPAQDNTGKLRYIFANIVEMIPELRILDIGYIINNELEFRSWFEIIGNNLKYFKCGVELSDERYIKSNNLMKISLYVKDLYRYFYYYNVSETETNLATWIFVTLHELGHIKYYNKYKKEYNKLQPINSDYSSNINNILNSNNLVSMESYFMTPTELYADQFAYRYFPYVWNNLKAMNLI